MNNPYRNPFTNPFANQSPSYQSMDTVEAKPLDLVDAVTKYRKALDRLTEAQKAEEAAHIALRAATDARANADIERQHAEWAMQKAAAGEHGRQ